MKNKHKKHKSTKSSDSFVDILGPIYSRALLDRIADHDEAAALLAHFTAEALYCSEMVSEPSWDLSGLDRIRARFAGMINEAYQNTGDTSFLCVDRIRLERWLLLISEHPEESEQLFRFAKLVLSQSIDLFRERIAGILAQSSESDPGDSADTGTESILSFTSNGNWPLWEGAKWLNS